MTSNELKQWLRDRLNFRGAPAAEINTRRDEAAYEYPAVVWQRAEDELRNDFRRTLIELVKESASGDWTLEGFHELMRLLEATSLYEAVQPLQEITTSLRNVSTTEAIQRRMLTLRTLLSLGWKGTPDFWLSQIEAIGSKWPELIFLGLAQHDLRMAFERLPDLLDKGPIDDVLMTFPIVMERADGGISAMHRLAQRVIGLLRPADADKLREWFAQQEYPLEQEQLDSTWKLRVALRSFFGNNLAPRARTPKLCGYCQV